MVMTNADASGLFSEMSVLLELEGANPFRVRAYQRAAMAIAAQPKPVLAMTPEERMAVPGIGKGIAEHLKEIEAGATFKELGTLRRKFPPGLIEMLRLPGLGPKRARFLFNEAGIANLAALKAAAVKGRLRGLRGFGAKLEESLLKGLAFAQQKPRLLHWDARQLAEELLALVRALPGVSAAEAAGSLRRGRETVGDIDILCAAPAAQGPGVIAAFVKSPRIARILASGPTKASVQLAGGPQCDLRVVPPASYGAALQYFTGSKEHNVALRELALKKGLTINEYGVYKLSDKKHARSLGGETEAEVYAALGLPLIPPEMRENRGEIPAALAGRLPRLVELKDIRGDFHNHSSHTDGKHALEEMARAAKKKGLGMGRSRRPLAVVDGHSRAQRFGASPDLQGARRDQSQGPRHRPDEIDGSRHPSRRPDGLLRRGLRRNRRRDRLGAFALRAARSRDDGPPRQGRA